jgi:hypothetical protein
LTQTIRDVLLHCGCEARSLLALHALARLTARIAHATRAKDLYHAVLDALTDAIGARRAAVLLNDAHGVMRFCSWCDLSEAYRARAEGHSPWRRDDHRFGRP